MCFCVCEKRLVVRVERNGSTCGLRGKVPSVYNWVQYLILTVVVLKVSLRSLGAFSFFFFFWSFMTRLYLENGWS